MDVLKQDHLRGTVLRGVELSVYVIESLVEGSEYITHCNDRLRGARTAGGPDGIIGTKVGSRSSKISLLVFEHKGSCIDPLSDLVTCSSLTHLILYIL